MTLEPVASVTGAVLLLGGCALGTIGLIGLIRKPDLFEQLHVAGLVTGPGVILVLLASVATLRADIITSALLVTAFVLVTSSISTHVIAQAGARRYAGSASGGGVVDRGLFPARGSSVIDPLPVADLPDREAIGSRVLIAHDGSPPADVAVALASALDWPAGTLIRVAGVVEDPLPSIDPWARDAASTRDPAPAGRVEGQVEGQVEGHVGGGIDTRLDAAIERVGRPGIRVERGVLHGDIADAIVEEAAAFRADLVMTGSRRGGIANILAGGSVLGEIVDRAPCPVLVARSSAVREVLLTTDGSPQSDAAADIVAHWPIFDLLRIRVVSVVGGTPRAGPDDPSGAATSEAQRLVDTTAAQLMDAGRDVVTEILIGRPATAIVELIEARSIDLVVIGSRGHTGLSRTLLGSVARDVLGSARCSVLLIGPTPRRPDAAPDGEDA
jgi:monovalent cation/proton antiporter MnhG/PhaG subunit